MGINHPLAFHPQFKPCIMKKILFITLSISLLSSFPLYSWTHYDKSTLKNSKTKEVPDKKLRAKKAGTPIKNIATAYKPKSKPTPVYTPQTTTYPNDKHSFQDKKAPIHKKINKTLNTQQRNTAKESIPLALANMQLQKNNTTKHSFRAQAQQKQTTKPIARTKPTYYKNQKRTPAQR